MATKDQDQKTSIQQLDRSSTAEVVQTVEKGVKPFQEFVTKFNNDWSMNLAAALAYNLLLATFPIIVALLSILGLVLGALAPDTLNTVFQGVTKALPAQTHPEEIIRGVQSSLQKSSGILGLFAVVSAIFFGSRLFVLLENFFSIIYRVRQRPLIRQNLMAIGMMLVFIILVPIMVFAASIPTLAFSLLQNTPVGQLSVLASVTGILGGLISSFILFEVIFVVVPNLHISLRHGWLGALVAAAALQLYLALFPVYVAHSLGGPASAVGFGLILLVFFYYFGVILLLGAEINAFFLEGVRPIPNDLATFVSTMAGKLNEDIPKAEGEAHVDAGATDQAHQEHAVELATDTEEQNVLKSGDETREKHPH
jgi:YihY family inner membrane protein